MHVDVPITSPPSQKKEQNEFEHVGWPHHTHRESAKLSPNGKFGRRAEAENNTEQAVMHNKNKKSKNLWPTMAMARMAEAKLQGVFFTGPPPKMSKYRKVNLG